MFALYLLATVIVLYLTNVYIKKRKFMKHLEHIDGPKPLPFIGNILEYPSTLVVLPKSVEFQNEYGGFFKESIGPIYTTVTVADLDFLEFLFTSQKLLTKSKDYNYIMRWLGHGLLTGPIDKWRKSRKMITPAFHFKILEKMVKQFPTSNKIMIKKLEKMKGVIDIYPIITLCALDNIYETAMGVRINAQECEKSEYVEAIKTILEIVPNRIFSIFKQNDFLYQFTSDYQRENKALKILHGTTNDVIRKRRKQLASSNKVSHNDDEDLGIKEKKAFLDMLLEYELDGRPLTDDEIRQEVDTILFAGHDTTASAISFALYCLSRHPDVQTKVFNEIINVLDKDIIPAYNDLQEMKYLEMVIKETLRLYPSAHTYARTVTEDIKYKDMIFPKDLTITVCAYAIHRNPEVFPDPEKFDPERFTPENQAKRNPYSYLPFSAGYRNCIGQKFAMMSMKSMISDVVRHFELSPGEPEVLLSAETIIISKTGVNMRLKKRI